MHYYTTVVGEIFVLRNLRVKRSCPKNFVLYDILSLVDQCLDLAYFERPSILLGSVYTKIFTALNEYFCVHLHFTFT